MKHFTPPEIPTAAPSAQFRANARQVVANPEQFAHRPHLRILAWMTLMAARGNKVDLKRLQQQVEAAQ